MSTTPAFELMDFLAWHAATSAKESTVKARLEISSINAELFWVWSYVSAVHCNQNV